MIKDLIVIDNFLDNDTLERVLNDSKHMTYYDSSSHPDSTKKLNWDGVRTENVIEYNYHLYSSVFNSIFIKSVASSFSHKEVMIKFNWNGYAYFHKLNQRYRQSWHHTDSNMVIAAVLYLNEHSPSNTGTIIDTTDGRVIVENKFNRLALYNANYTHSPEDGFDDRLTLTFFIESFNINLQCSED